MKKRTVVLSLGGSLIAPASGINTTFLRRFRALILKYTRRGYRFVIMCGGGATARAYQSAAAKVVKLTRDDLDWIGIHATRLNAHLMRTLFREAAHPKIIKNPHEDMCSRQQVIIGAGWRPGCSTDYDAVLLAGKYGADTLINLSNIAHVYDKDPRKFPDARAIKALDWRSFRLMFGTRWDPGLNSPFDPVASKEAERRKLRVVIADGGDLANLARILEDRRFEGTVIDSKG